MTERQVKRTAARLARLAAGTRNVTDYPMPQPTGPFSANVVPVTFESWRYARLGIGHPALIKAFKKFGAYGIKPHRNSSGVIWNGRAYWWTPKGFYRAGKMGGPRPPLQHLVWAHHHRRPVPRGHEIFFRDRNRNNFAPANLECLSKGDLHRRCIDLGETRQLTRQQRSEISGKRWTNHSRRNTAALLANFNRGGSTVAQLKRKP